MTATATKIDKDAIKAAASARGWPVILSSLAGIDIATLDGSNREHPCPKCGGKTRFRMVDVSAGALFCNRCHNGSTDPRSGDGISALQWLRGWDFKTTCNQLAEYLGLSNDRPKATATAVPIPRPATTKPNQGGSKFDPVAKMAELKNCPADSLCVYGGKQRSQQGSDQHWCDFPLYGAGGCQCSKFEVCPYSGLESERKGRNQKGRPAGVFLPHDEYGKVCLPKAGETWIVCEGVKDAAALHKLGYLVIGLPGSYFKNEWLPLVQGVDIALCLDNDENGNSKAPEIKAKLDDTAASVPVVTLPGPGDVRDNLAAVGEDAVKKVIDTAAGDADNSFPPIQLIGELIAEHPHQRTPIIQDIQREAETANVISVSKAGKSWLVMDLALSVVTGRPWLGQFETMQGNVLLIDNELTKETLSSRTQTVAKARDIELDEYYGGLHVESLRGNQKDVFELAKLFSRIEEFEYRLVIIDALYRCYPEGVDENSNAGITKIYNAVDQYAAALKAGFVMVHHATKGNQSGKAITDVGSGAGAQSRATDCHLVLRPHQEEDCVVLEAVTRSFPPVDPLVLRWQFPCWNRAPDLDPSALKTDRHRRGENRQAEIKAKLQNILDSFEHFPDGALKTDIRNRVGQGRIFDAAWLEACNSGKLSEVEIRKANGRPYTGYKLVESKDPAESQTKSVFEDSTNDGF